jgi:hypothetical protein
VTPLTDLIAAELAAPADPRAVDLAAAIAAAYPRAARAVLFYGSALREANLDGLMLDFYLIVSGYEAAYGRGWLARANRLLPPNVFPFARGGLSAKYAVLSEADFARLCRPDADNVSVWARFAQPSRLVWAADAAARGRVVEAVARAPVTLLSLARPMVEGERDDILTIWRRGFELTYDAELRAERGHRPGGIVDADPDRYARFGAAALADLRASFPREGGGPWLARSRIPWTPAFAGERRVDFDGVRNPIAAAEAAARWRKLQRRGKWLSVARLAKASFTFAGGIDYLAWKINRHAGTAIVIRPWQRRWPLLAALILLPRLLWRGAVK